MPEDATMSYTIVEDPSETGIPAMHVRAMISTRTELEELIAKLTVRLNTDFAQGETSEHHPTAREPIHSRPALPAPSGARTGCTGAHTQIKEDGFTRAFRGD